MATLLQVYTFITSVYLKDMCSHACIWRNGSCFIFKTTRFWNTIEQIQDERGVAITLYRVLKDKYLLYFCKYSKIKYSVHGFLKTLFWIKFVKNCCQIQI